MLRASVYTHPFVDGALLQIRRLHWGLLLVGVQLGGRPLLRPTRERISLRPRLVRQPADVTMTSFATGLSVLTQRSSGQIRQ
jgi:hypothetical protein